MPAQQTAEHRRLAEVSNRFQNIRLAVALWNERDPILKERLFGY